MEPSIKAFVFHIPRWKYLFLTFLLLICAVGNMLYAQTLVRGIVYEYRGHEAKKPLAGVEIVAKGAGSTVTDAKGNFTLKFITAVPGEKITVRRIMKPGYELFKPELVESWFVPAEESARLVAVLCKTEELQRQSQRYYHAAELHYVSQFEKDKKQIDLLHAQNAIDHSEYEAKLKKLKYDYEKKLESIDNYIELFNRIDLSELNENAQKIVECVEAGNLDQAIELYEKESLADKYIQQIEKIQRANQAIEKFSELQTLQNSDRDSIFQAAVRQTMLLRTVGGKESWDKILKLTESIAYADTTRVEPMLFHALQCYKMTRYKEAAKSAAIALRNVTPGTLDHVHALSSYSACIRNLYNNNDLAISLAEQSLSMIDTLTIAAKDSTKFLEYKADAEYHYAMAVMQVNHGDHAIFHMQNAIQGYATIANSDSLNRNIRYRFVRALIFLGEEFRIKGEHEANVELCNQAIRITHELHEKRPLTYNAILAFAYHRKALGYDYWEEHTDEAIDNYLIAGQYYDQAMEFNPEATKKYKANNLLDLAEAYEAKGNLASAKEALLKAIELDDTEYKQKVLKRIEEAEKTQPF